MADPSPIPVQAPIYWVGQCHHCGRTRAADRDDIFRFMRDCWPQCCSHTMTFRIVHGEPPHAEPVD